MRFCMSGNELQYLKSDKRGSKFPFGRSSFLGIVDELGRVSRGIEGAGDSRSIHRYQYFREKSGSNC